jgi:Uma2 family endonuclease
MISPLTAQRRPPNPLYPDSDGQPMAENTLQFNWIVTIKENLEALFASRDDVFVAGDLLWYAVEGRPEIRLAPDAMVVFGRPKGYRGSYMQWEEDGVAPQVVFEVLSPGNRAGEMQRKLEFYQRYGVEEYYLYDPERNLLDGWLRDGDALRPIAAMDGWSSPRLAVRFECADDTLRIIRPDGKPFLPVAQVMAGFEEAQDRLQQQADEIEEAQQRIRQQAEANARAQEQLRQQVEANARAQEQLRQQADELARLRRRLEALGENVDNV